MQALQQGSLSLRAEARRLVADLRDWRLLVSLGLFAALLLIVAQAPLRATIEVGLEEGFGADLPLIANFHASESSEFTHSNFRWTTGQSLIRLPGEGQRPVELSIQLLPISPDLAQQSPKAIELWANGRLLSQVAVRPSAGERLTVLLPPDRSGDQIVEIRSATFVPNGDRRAIGLPVDQIGFERVGGLALPAWRPTLAWLAAALALWLGLRRTGIPRAAALAILLAGVALASLAALLDPPRFAFGAGAALIATTLGWLLVLLLAADPAGLLLAGLALLIPAVGLSLAGQLSTSLADPAMLLGAITWSGALALALAGWLRPPLAALYRQAGPPLPAAALRWLLLLALIILATHYGVKLYPDAMWGDIGFHSNRYQEVVGGRVLLLSRNRGVDFPYPPAFYLLLAPLALAGLDHRVLLQLGGALINALGPFVAYAIGAGALAGPPGDAIDPRARRVGLLAAGIYSLTAATLMTTLWNFSTHIFSQFAHLLLIAALLLLWRRTTTDRRPIAAHHPSSFILHPSSLIALFVLQSMVYLGHFGFWINTSLLGGIGLAALLLAAVRGRVSWRTFRLLLAGFAAAEVFAALFFYSAYAGLFIAQARATAAGGLTGMQNKQAVEISALWQSLWDAGLRVHFGFFPIPLALCGLALLWPRPKDAGRPNAQTFARSNVQGLLVLMVGTFAVALLFGSLPFITRAALSTRWLMFSAWAVAVCAALAAELLWRSGRAGRWLIVAMGGYIIWVTASMWLGALAWRIRPPEPF